ncbi:hypothetical protein PUN28_005792 [Cardiocondyla obscurior]|uniref:Uncharacterized protein n=1 Tax=Cardiocondyla obscurior TaxID=286306 RepID=A0AAW2G663_9HYME
MCISRFSKCRFRRVNRDFRNTRSRACCTAAFIARVLLPRRLGRRRQLVNWQVPSVVGRPWLVVAFPVLLQSLALAFRNRRDKELEVAEQ